MDGQARDRRRGLSPRGDSHWPPAPNKGRRAAARLPGGGANRRIQRPGREKAGPGQSLPFTNSPY
ncbi:hypothetical protein Salmuc_05488 [Salipiger mucosus DSM 16094]|uniref:Uncharacterized protein n=1 Tax=Salipiger mucosus DSM 16094 TaxID=1123237 RepID=S9QJ14_9RHOB|nr:hypothetical protein Salmuc_05488 [Salipiger mucosus DSM 16094]